jgi:hypothetical protein
MNGNTLVDFDGETWVAFSDLCGTRAMYRTNPKKAAEALDEFYNAVYAVQRAQGEVSALAVSDCAVFWVHGVDRGGRTRQMLAGLLERLKRLHRQMVDGRYLVRTTVAYGHFRYQRRLEIPRLRKDMIVGGAYLDAYAANDRVRKGAIFVLRPQDGADWPDCAGRCSPFLCGSQRAKKREFVWWVDAADQVVVARRRIKETEKAEIRALLAAYGGP